MRVHAFLPKEQRAFLMIHMKEYREESGVYLLLFRQMREESLSWLHRFH